MPKYPEAIVGSFSSWLGELPTNRIGVHFVGRTRSRRPASWRCSLPDTNLFRSFSSRRIFRDGRQRRATTLRRSLTISGMSFPIVRPQRIPTIAGSLHCADRESAAGCTLEGSRKDRSTNPVQRTQRRRCPHALQTTSPDNGRLRRRVVVTEPQTEDFGPTRVASIDTATAGSVIANATFDSSRIRRFPGHPTSSIKTRKDTSEKLIFWGIPLRPSDLGFWWR